ncbi:MAG TPA: single-stranded-DNA-specific exonuclease RecJ [Bacteroidales bacterium]|nr:single-stranded-DNA-specific exonuclease RecJ [Bacteroidales bacterium]
MRISHTFVFLEPQGAKMQKRWNLLPISDKNLIARLRQEVSGIDDILANILVQREITTFQDAKTFFRPQLSDLHDPFLMKDMDKAVHRINLAIRRNEKILIYGDYDVDGTTAVALMYDFLFAKHQQIDFYIPDRYAEGYGVSNQGIDYAYNNGYSLIIALDCGIKSEEKVEYASSRGIDFVICDHHRPGEHLPEAISVLDPKRLDCPYPCKDLSGCGIGFKLAQALNKSWGINDPAALLHLLDLVAVSIAADIVPITGENRILAHYGLQLLNKKPRPGILAILKVGGIVKETDIGSDTTTIDCSRELTISDLVFNVGPRINAAGRMESGRESVVLLTCNNLEEAMRMAGQIDQYNTSRRSLDMQITQEAHDMIEKNEQFKNHKSTIVYSSNWHKGVIGIVASRLIEQHYRPTIVFTLSNGLITGSARSIKDFDIYDAIDSCSDLLEHFGGHKYAAGLSLKPARFDEFCKRFENVVSETVNENMMIPQVDIDAELHIHQINSRFTKILKQFAPFGPGNMSPLFITSGIIDTGKARIVGKNHLKLEIVHPSMSGNPLPAIAFQQGEHLAGITAGKPFDICYHLEENHWNGYTSLQLNIKEMRPTMQEE